MAEFGYTASLMSLFIVLFIYSFSCAYNTNFNNKQTNKQTNKREISWQYDTYKTPCQTARTQKKKNTKIDRIRYIFTFRALGLIVPGADQYKTTLL